MSISIPHFLLGVNVNNVPMASGTFNALGGHYTLNGTACAITDIIDTAHPDGNFDPATDIDAGGVISPAALYLKNPLLSAVLGGFTVLFEANFTSTAGTLTQLSVAAADYPDYNFNIGALVVWQAGVTDQVGLTSVSDSRVFMNRLHTTGVHKIAMTCRANSISASVDGQAVDTYAAAGTDPTSTACYFQIGNDPSARIRSFAFYGVVDDSDLPSLSA